MKLSTRGQYAVMGMVDLAKFYDLDQPTSLSAIAVRQDISLPYLEQLFSKLRRADLVKSVRGPHGGYFLSDAPQKIRLSQIIDAADEEISITRCSAEPGVGCSKEGVCHTHYLWQALTDHISSFFDSVTLDDLLKRKPLTGMFCFATSVKNAQIEQETAKIAQQTAETAKQTAEAAKHEVASHD